MHARWPSGLLLTSRHERWRAQVPGDARLKTLKARDLSGVPLGSLVAAATTAGFDNVIVQHDAVGAEGTLEWERLRGAGLSGVSLRCEGEAALHNFIADQEPAQPLLQMEGTDATAELVREQSLELHLRTRVARSNFRSLGAVLARALAWGAKTWTLEYVPLSRVGLPPQGVGHTHPRLALSLPWVLRAGTQAASRGLPFALRGAPLCLLGPLASHAVAETAGKFGPVCAGCAARKRCVGADPTYFARFGFGELHARPAPTEPSPGWWSVAAVL